MNLEYRIDLRQSVGSACWWSARGASAGGRRKLMAIGVSLVVCLGACRLEPLRAQTPQLEEINLKVQERTVELEAVRNRERSLDGEMKEIRASIARVKKDRDAIESELQDNEQRRREVTLRLEQLTQRQAKIRALSMERVRALYTSRQRGTFDRVLFAGDSPYFGRQVFFLKAVHEFDQKLLENLKEISIREAAERAELEMVLAEQQDLRGKVEQKRLALEERLTAQSRIGADLKKQRARIEQVLAELRAQALRIETVVSSLTVAPDRGKSPGPSGKPGGQSPASGGVPGESFDGPGLKGRDVTLVRPIEGKVVGAFGRKRGAEFEDMVRSKGIEFLGAEGQPVRAVGLGRVLFSGLMPGFSHMVILDHGKRMYSLYGRLNNPQVARGQVVNPGESLGSLGLADNRGSNFYFEMREQGRPIDPGPFLPKL